MQRSDELGKNGFDKELLYLLFYILNFRQSLLSAITLGCGTFMQGSVLGGAQYRVH